MRISDWSSDVCSSDLKRQKDEEADLERGLQFAGDEGGQQDGEGHVRRRGIGLVLLQIGEELDVLLARLPHHEGVENRPALFDRLVDRHGEIGSESLRESVCQYG